MDPSFYKTLHFCGIISLVLGLGVVIARESKCSTRLAMIFHGFGALLLLVSGFGLQAKLGHPFDPWLIGKLAIWFVLAGLVAIARRKLLPATVLWLAVVVLATAAAWLGQANSQLLR